MSAVRLFDKFAKLLDVSWPSIADGQTLKRSGSNIIGYTPGGGSGDVVGPASSLDSEVALYSGTGGKTIKRATGTGVPVVINGVWGTPVTDVKDYVPAGSVVQTGYVEVLTEVGTPLKWPIGPIVYNITDGLEFLSLNFTPKYANSKLLIRTAVFVDVYMAAPSYINCPYVLFRSGISTGLVAFMSTLYHGVPAMICGQYLYTPGAVTTRTYSLRIAAAIGAVAVDTYVNGYQYVSGGFKPVSSMTIEEIKQ